MYNSYNYIYIYKQPNRTSRTETNCLISEQAGTGCGNKPNRTGPSHDASENSEPSEPCRTGTFIFPKRTEPNRSIFEKLRNRNESDGTGSFPPFAREGPANVARVREVSAIRGGRRPKRRGKGRGGRLPEKTLCLLCRCLLLLMCLCQRIRLLLLLSAMNVCLMCMFV